MQNTVYLKFKYNYLIIKKYSNKHLITEHIQLQYIDNSTIIYTLTKISYLNKILLDIGFHFIPRKDIVSTYEL